MEKVSSHIQPTFHILIQNIMIGQVAVYDCDVKTAPFIIEKYSKSIISHGNSYIPSMVSRGGGLTKVETKILSSEKNVLVVNIFINVCDSMGANAVNTVCESVSNFISQILPNSRIGLKILSNLCVARRAISTFSIPVSKMGWKYAKGEEVAKKIIEALEFAQMDVFRATTHNKGIMNGIVAVALALGQDTRAIEAGAHSFASFKSSKYSPLTKYELAQDAKGEMIFCGSLEIPISVGSKGGVVDTNPVYHENFKLLQLPKAKDLAEIMVTVGLAQNFAALRALAIEGIQKGHMQLHARNIAVSVGVPANLVDEACRSMKMRGKITRESALAFMAAHDLYSQIREFKDDKVRIKALSTFFIEINPNSTEPITVNVAFDCGTEDPIHLTIENETGSDLASENLKQRIFGNKNFTRITEIFKIFSLVEQPFQNVDPPIWIKKLKLLVILIDVVGEKMLFLNNEKTISVLHNVLQELKNKSFTNFQEFLRNEAVELRFGLNLFCELIQIFIFTLRDKVSNKNLIEILTSQLTQIIESLRSSHQLFNAAVENKVFAFQEFLFTRKKRLCATIFAFINSISSLDVPLWGEEETKKIAILELLGDCFETIVTFSRDLKKCSPEEINKEVNLLSYWLLGRNSGSNLREDFIMQKKEFKAFAKSIISQKKMKVAEILSEPLFKLVEAAEKTIYKIYEDIDESPKL